MMSLISYFPALALFLSLVTLALCGPSCYGDNPYKPSAVMTWGFDGFKDSAPSSKTTEGWQTVNAITGQTMEETRQEALQWYSQRYGFNNTVLSYDPVSGTSQLPQGTMLPVYLTLQGDYGLWAESEEDVVEQRCATIAVVEWVLFTNPSVAGTPYNGTFGEWSRRRNSANDKVSVNDVFSIGRYLIKGTKKNDKPLVLTFKTWFPVRQDEEHTYRVDNVIHHPELGWGYGQSNYRYWPTADDTSRWFVQIRNTVKFPFIEPPPISPTAQ